MGQPSTSAQIRAVALKEAVAAQEKGLPSSVLDTMILQRAERFASYIEHGEEVDPNA